MFSLMKMKLVRFASESGLEGVIQAIRMDAGVDLKDRPKKLGKKCRNFSQDFLLFLVP